MKISTDTWKLYYSIFKDGDDVIIITEDDIFDWGKLKTLKTKDEISLKRPLGKKHYYKFDEIRFMSHDGFPVKRLMGTRADDFIDMIDTSDMQSAIRQALTIKEVVVQKTELKKTDYTPRTRTIERSYYYGGRIGDPFLISNCSMTLLNTGNNKPKFYNQPLEETILCESEDGIQGLLWDLSTMSGFELSGHVSLEL